MEAVATAHCWARTPSPPYQGGNSAGGKGPLGEVALVGAKPRDKAHKAAAERATAVAEEVNRARDLINTPPNDLNPKAFAAAVQAAGKEHGLKVEVLDEKALLKGGYGGILGVGQGSATPPRLVRVAYTHPKAKKTVALVGKGITYDSGGISLKPPGHNETMKCDMSGAAAVFADRRGRGQAGPAGQRDRLAGAGREHAVRRRDASRRRADRCTAARPSRCSTRTPRAGWCWRTRWRGPREENPDAIVDVATLTGAMVLALGNRTFGDHVERRRLPYRAARDRRRSRASRRGRCRCRRSCARRWTRRSRTSPNMGERAGGGLVAGLFLQEFVGEGITWAHLDIAGPAFHEGAPFGYTPKGGTGSAVRTLVRLAEQAAAGDAARAVTAPGRSPSVPGAGRAAQPVGVRGRRRHP